MKKINFIFVFLLMFIFTGLVKVNAALTPPSSLTLHYTGDSLDMGSYGEGRQFFYCDSDDFDSSDYSCPFGKYNLFCIDYGTQVTPGVRYTTNAGSISTSGPACGVLEAALDSSITSITLPSSNGDTYYIREFSPADYIKIQKDIWDNESNTDECVHTERTNLSGGLSISVDSIDLTRSGSNYVGSVTVTKTNLNGKYTITKSNSNLIVSETEGGANVTSSNAGTLYFRIPTNIVNSNSSYTVTISGKYNSQTVQTYTPFIQMYSPITSGLQTMGILGMNRSSSTVQTNVNDTVTLNVTVPTGKITINKKDDTSAALAGAKFEISSNSNFSNPQTITIGPDGKGVKEGLAYGTYYIRESEAPAGYVKDTHTETVTLTAGDTANYEKSVDFVNTPINIILSKVDFGTKKNLAGAKITVKTLKNGSIANFENAGLTNGTWTSTNATVTLSKVVPGDYYIYESKIPDGYEGGTYTVDKQEKTAVLHIKIGTDGTITSRELGTINGNSFVKITPPEDSRSFFNVNTTNNKITVYNYKLTTISKKDITGEKELEGAHIVITNDADKDFKKEFVSTKEPTKMYLEKLANNKYYYMTETVAPVGYETLVTVFKFTVDENGKPTLVSIGKWEDEAKTKYKEEKKVSSTDNFKTKDNTITLLDEPIKIELYKKDSDTKKMIKGAHLVIKDESKKKTIKECDSQASDPCKLDLEPGIYYFMETKTPDGYEKNTAEYKIQVLESREVKLLSDKSKEISVNKNTITLYNVKVEVPDTGKSKNNNLLIIAIAGVLLAGLGLIVYILIKRKKA